MSQERTPRGPDALHLDPLEQFGEQDQDTLIDLVTDGTHLVWRKAGWIGDVPVEIALAWIEGAFVAASHGDDDV